MSDILKLDPSTTALVLVDLQAGIVGLPLAPLEGRVVAERCARLASAFRARGAPVVFVRVDLAAMEPLPVDQPLHDASAPPPPPEASELVVEAGRRDGDLLVVKTRWGAFASTGLDEELRRRGVRTIVVGGIATNMGVESTARAAADHGYAVVFVSDLMTSVGVDAHEFAVGTIFPLMGRVRRSEDVVAALAA